MNNLKFVFLFSIFVLNCLSTFSYHSEEDTISIQSNSVPKASKNDSTYNQGTNAVLDSNKVVSFGNFLSDDEFQYIGSNRFTLNGINPKRDTEVEILPFSLTLASWGGLFAFQHYLQMNTIWKEQGDFRIIEDGKYALYSDKAGHFFGTYFTAYLVQESLFLSGFNWEASTLISTAVGLAYSTYIEILDGYGINWGFSPSDLYADIAGAAFFLGQFYFPILQNFTPKFMYFPAPWFGSNHRRPHDAMIDDYSSHTLWLSVNVHNLLPSNLKKYVPDWLELSFGYGARNLCTPGLGCENNSSEAFFDEYGNVMVYGDPKYILAFDVNLVKLLPDGGSFWNWFKQSLNYIKMPTPAIEFGNVTRFYLLYPFPINLN